MRLSHAPAWDGCCDVYSVSQQIGRHLLDAEFVPDFTQQVGRHQLERTAYASRLVGETLHYPPYQSHQVSWSGEIAGVPRCTVLVLAHLFDAFNARSDTTSAFAHLFANP